MISAIGDWKINQIAPMKENQLPIKEAREIVKHFRKSSYTKSDIYYWKHSREVYPPFLYWDAECYRYIWINSQEEYNKLMQALEVIKNYNLERSEKIREDFNTCLMSIFAFVIVYVVVYIFFWMVS